MVAKKSKKGSRYGFGLACCYGLLVWFLFSNQSLPFPLGGEDHIRVAAALRSGTAQFEDSWIGSGLLDPVLGLSYGGDLYAPMKGARTLAATLALVGMAVWVWRAKGWVAGCWVGLLGIGFLPFRIAAASLGPQPFCSALLIWGIPLAFGKPWSKTGAAEQLGGGLLLGAACLASPWGYLFALPLPIWTCLSKRAPKRLERTFFQGFFIGLLPGLLWLGFYPEALGAISGWRIESIRWAKSEQLVHLVRDSFGWFFFFLLLIGMAGMRGRRDEETNWTFHLCWPLILVLVLGYADPMRASLALPGLMWMSVAGLEQFGRVFVSKTEARLVPSLLAVALAYHTFFSGLPVMRERQSHSREVKALAGLIVEKVPTKHPVALFRLSPLIDLINATEEGKHWDKVSTAFFPGKPADAVEILGSMYANRDSLWLDPKRLGESGVGSGGLGEEYLNYLKGLERAEVVEESRFPGVSLLRLDLSSSPPKSR